MRAACEALRVAVRDGRLSAEQSVALLSVLTQLLVAAELLDAAEQAPADRIEASNAYRLEVASWPVVEFRRQLDRIAPSGVGEQLGR
ncbi:hypothetical protein [Pseudonocardia sp. H11422]|uniref:hypothetical protein n=1 Tax=Pseudonocardia sp. H11422 TaxID=2835866 RepID=UPI001BDDB50A|nr:hypothetical protein [Pseudonocardia sp. H11422]